MQLKTAIAALALIAVPVLASAECGWEHKNQSVSQCPTGQTYDSTTGTCTTLSTS